MIKQNTWIRPLIVIVVTSILSSLTVLYRTSSTIKQLELENDSLINQNFILQTEVGRYEMGIEIFKERNPSSGKQLGEIINHETE